MGLTVEPGQPKDRGAIDAIWDGLDDLEELRRTELSRIRAAAAGWRTSLGGLLLALFGFSLVKGRSDIGELADGWSVVVGVLLLVALLARVSGTIFLTRACHGNPFTSRILRQDLGTPAQERRGEARDATCALLCGLWCAALCGVCLVAAVGVTWYGPGRGHPAGKPGKAAAITVQVLPVGPR